MNEEWTEPLKRRYGDRSSDESIADWNAAKAKYRVGEWIEGKVVAVAHFGVWIDFEIDVPGLLLIHRFCPPLKPGPGGYPAIGDSLRSRLISFAEGDKVLVLSQDVDEQVF